MNIELFEQIKQLSKQVSSTKVCIALDWLSIYMTHVNFFNEQMTEGDSIIISEDCYLLAIDRPTQHFNKHVVLMYKKTECAHILYDSKNEKFFAKDVAKVEFINHTLYSGVWHEVFKILKDEGLKYKATSRLDIAIDGANYLPKMLNIYAKQTLKDRTVRLKNSSETRARFSAKVLNPKTMNFENFNIGSGGGNKMITVYNKSLEIAKSGKMYIQDYWLANGVIKEIADYKPLDKQLEQAKKSGQDIVRVEGMENIYRFEIRLKSESIKEIEGFNIELLTHKKGLASIVKCHCKNYFEMQYCDDTNISRCTPIALLPYDQLEAEQITKIQRVEKDGLYKAKMTIHGLVQDIYKGHVQLSNSNESIEVIMDRVIHYNLIEYLDKKLLEWHTKYSPMIDKDNLDNVTIIINQLQQRNNQLTHDNDIAHRHNQAGATAAFGE